MGAYRSVPGSRLTDSDAAVIGPELERIAAAHDGMVLPQVVVDTARDTGSPLHGYMEWHDPTAAHEYRLEQARKLARSIEVQIIGADGAAAWVHGFHHLTITRTLTVEAVETTDRVRGYVTYAVAQAGEGYWEQLVARAERDLRAFQERYDAYMRHAPFAARFAPVMGEIAALTPAPAAPSPRRGRPPKPRAAEPPDLDTTIRIAIANGQRSTAVAENTGLSLARVNERWGEVRGQMMREGAMTR